MSFFSIVIILTVGISTLLLLLVDDWRGSLTGLGIQYLISFVLVTRVWPVGLAAIKLVAGWLACVLLGMAIGPYSIREEFYSTRAARIFRLLSALFIFIIVLMVAPTINVWLPIPYDHLLNGLLMIGMGIIQLGFSKMYIKVFSGILTLLTGFEIIYAPLEGSALLAAILAGITLALGLIGSTILQRDQYRRNA